jgi:YggT family protein
MNLLATAVGLYSVIILIRIVLTWFSGANFGKPMEILCRITDPYLNWWRRIPGLRLGFLDLSPIAAMAALSIVQSVFSTIARYGRISLGIIVFLILSALWSVLSFIIGFCLIVLVLRLAAYLTNRNVYSGFWQIIDTISRPLLYRINRIVFGKRLVRYLTGILAAIAVLALLWLGGRFAMQFLLGLLGN